MADDEEVSKDQNRRQTMKRDYHQLRQRAEIDPRLFEAMTWRGHFVLARARASAARRSAPVGRHVTQEPAERRGRPNPPGLSSGARRSASSCRRGPGAPPDFRLLSARGPSCASGLLAV